MVHDLVAIAGNSVNIVEAICGMLSAFECSMCTWVCRTLHAQLLEGVDTAGLQQLSNNAVRFLKALFQQYDAPALITECNGGSTAQDTSADNDNVSLMVDAPPLLAGVDCMGGLGCGGDVCGGASLAQLWRRRGGDPRRQLRDFGTRIHGEHGCDNYGPDCGPCLKAFWLRATAVGGGLEQNEAKQASKEASKLADREV